MNRSREDAVALEISVVPEPTTDERDAILAVLTILGTGTKPGTQQSVENAWAVAGRVEATRGLRSYPGRRRKRAPSAEKQC